MPAVTKSERKDSRDMINILIDTNVIIDYLADRAPFADASEELLNLCREDKVLGAVTANAITDIYYVVRKKIGRAETLEAVRTLCSFLEIADIGKTDILGAMELEMNDYEDASVAYCAMRTKSQYIITRNEGDFVNSSVPVLSPSAFLSQCFPE